MEKGKSEVILMRELGTFASVTQMLQKRKIEFQNLILQQKVIEANYYISKQLSVPLATKVFCLERLRIIAGKRVSVEKTYICYERVEGLEEEKIENRSFYDVLEDRYGYKIKKSQEEILIVEANDQERELLELEKGDEVVLIKGSTYADEKMPLEYFETVSIPSLYRFRSTTKI